VIKFRCQRCSQKIAVNNEGIGLAIPCPTCAESLIVPPRTDREFIPHTADAVPLELVPAPAPVARVPWTRLIMEKVLPALLAQRRELLQTQDEATEQLAALEQRVVLLQMKFQRRLAYYQERVTTLEAENRELARQARSAAENSSAAAASFGLGRINLRNTGFLLRT
jgi:DNA-directed RNA polymerase subunit RPC12/RpoP